MSDRFAHESTDIAQHLPSGKSRGNEINHRQLRALELRLTGMPYEDIADTLGYAGRAAAYSAVRAVIARREHEAVEEMRQIEGDRLDTMAATLWPLVKTGDLQAVDRMLKIMQRRAALFGLDLAGRVDVMAAGEVDLDGAFARILAVARGTTNPDPEPPIEGGDGDSV